MSPFSIVKGSPSDPGPATTPGWTGFSWSFFDAIYEDFTEGLSETITGVEVITYLDNNEILGAVSRGEVDLGHAAITQTERREQLVDFSAAWFFTGFKVLTRHNSAFIERIKSIAATLGSAIGLYGATLVLLGLAGALILGPAERISPGPIQPWNMNTWWENTRGAFRCTMSILFNSPTIEPVGKFAKPLVGIFKGFAAYLPIMATALTTLVLLINSQSNKINGFSDLPGHTVIVPRATTAYTYMRENGNGISLVETATIGEALDRFAEGEGDAVIFDLGILEAFELEQERLTGSDDYLIVGELFERQQYGIAVSPGLSDDYLEPLNRAILLHYDTPEYNRFEDQWFGSAKDDVNVQLENANDQLLVLIFAALALLAFGIIVTVIYLVIKSSGMIKEPLLPPHHRFVPNQTRRLHGTAY
jgi:ABC-type amino acid transport substrate-binding protein